MENLQGKIKGDYGQIAQLNQQLGAEAQRQTVCQSIYGPIKHRYQSFEGYLPAADFGLGCGFPFAYADIGPGQSVLDLGCAAGIDTFIVGRLVGPAGQVTGLDLTPELIERAQATANHHGIRNATFLCANISQVPLPDAVADAIISNGVFSLLPDLESAFAQVHRLLKPGGIFCLADITRKVDFDEEVYANIKAFTGCLNGIRKFDTYLQHLEKSGFTHWTLAHERSVALPPAVAPEENKSGVFISTIKAIK